MKIFYCGLQYDKYDSKRGLSFEHENFYSSLADYPGAEVRCFPFDDILTRGKSGWNRELVEAVRKERPDLVFAFMLSDEFEAGALEELKKLTATVAWFADDHWRLWNYSRYWAPHFTWAVTTWSRAPEIYRRYGITNVVRSQWAANPRLYKPLEKMPKDEERPDVVFVGGWTRPRQKMISALLKAGIQVRAYGSGFPGGRVSREEMIKLFSVAKINLGLNPAPGYFNQNSLGRLFFRRSLNRIVPDLRIWSNFRAFLRRGIPQIKGRHFEIPACGGFVITGEADDIQNYYVPNKEMVFYKNTDDLIKKVRYYLEHKEEREAIARAGYERTIREHTYEKRFKELFRKIGL